jgi:hypothetical protein
MEHKERIATYLSGCTDKKGTRKMENALIRDARILDSFIEVIEAHLYIAPSSLAAAVMRNLPVNHTVVVSVPALGRKLCAAVCFSSAAAIMLFTTFGFNQYITEFIHEQSGRFTELFSFIQNISFGGN